MKVFVSFFKTKMSASNLWSCMAAVSCGMETKTWLEWITCPTTDVTIRPCEPLG